MVERISMVKRSVLLLFLLIVFMLLISQMNWFWRLIYPLKFEDVIMTNAKKYKIDPYLVAAIVFVESKYLPSAQSRSGAMGLMQIMPDTGSWIAEQLSINDFHSDKLLEPDINIMFGCWYLSNLKNQFNNDITIVLAAYNAGRGNVKKWLDSDNWDGSEAAIDDLPFPETRNYLRQVLLVYEKYKKIYNFE